MVTIIIPVYNSEKHIAQCLNSVVSQTYKDYECLCIDDGSTDSSSSIIHSFTRQDNRFHYYFQRNRGVSAARNHGLDEAKGKYILFVDSDDTIMPDYLETLLNAAERCNADICCCGYTNKEKDRYYHINDYPIMTASTREAFLDCLFSGTGGTICSKLFRTTIIRENKIYLNENFSFCEDQLFALQVYCVCDRFISVEHFGYIYHRYQNGVTQRLSTEQWYQQFRLIDLMTSIMTAAGIDQNLIDNCIEKKSKNVLIGLTMRTAMIDKSAVKKMLNDHKVDACLRKITIQSKSDVKWMLPLKFKLYSVIMQIYVR